MSAGIPAAVAKFFGTATYSLLNIVFIISSCAVGVLLFFLFTSQ
jgi:hypothetical protein